MKKTLSLILALLMSASCASYIFADDTAIAEEATTTEAVVEEAVEEAAEEATPYDRAITFLNTYGIMKGMEDGLLHAEKDVERYQMALFLGRIATGWVDDDSWEDFDANDSGFADLKGTAAENVYGAMSYVSQKGIIEGYPDGTFKPEQVVTYREALTMAVRTLGYQGLEYPWGYIEKAVALGLTDGITGVAYTDVINRGVAAQIIYNAMFADNSKLGLANFGRAFGWADILVTSTVVNDTTTAKDGTDVRATYTNAAYKTPTGYVAFQMIESDGTLGKDIYYVQSSELGLAGHEDELALGAPYAALFEIDEDDNLVELVAAEPYAATTVKNEGRTDNEGVAYDTVDNIAAYLKDYTLVDKYSAKVLANSGKLANELIVAQAAELTKTVIDYAKTPFAFDWATGDILEATKKDGKYIVDEDGNYVEYVVKYYYNAEYDYYFEIKTKETVSGSLEYVGISIMTEDDVAELRKAIDKACEVEVADGLGYVSANIGGIYATLTTYDLDDDGLAEYGTYESYNYGKISQKADAKKCPKCDANRDSVMINGTWVDFLESADCGADSHIDGAWWQDEYAPVLDEDGKIVSAYVIYGYNKVTKELKVIKTIEAYSEDLVDADTYYATGILRGYSISNGYVVIGDQKIYFNEDFGTFDIDKDSKDYKDGAYKAYLTSIFDGLFNQFVRYYLLDGKVVEIETVKTGAAGDYLVVESYAGISNDGYIVVNGYNTNDLKLERYRIAVYDGWDEGDFFWNPTKISDEFVKGNVYKVRSYDADEDVYFVDVMGDAQYDAQGNFTGIDYDVDNEVELTFETGYRNYITSKGVQSTKKVSSSDKYIIIGQGKDGYMPIAVFEGKVTDDNWTVKGDLLVGDKDAKTFIFVNVKDTDVTGFNLDAWTNAGLVMVLKYTVLDKFYDGADAEDWYLNGATEYGNVVAFNFLNGKFDDVKASTNLKPKAGKVYKTIDGVIAEEVTNTWSSIWTTITTTYADSKLLETATDTSDYVYGVQVPVVEDYFGDDAKKALSLNEVRGIFGITAKATDLVNSIKLVLLEKDGDVVTDITPYGKDEWKADVKAGLQSVNAYAVYAIRDDGTVDAVLYIDPDTAYIIATDDEVKVTSDNALQLAVDAGIVANVEAEKVTTTINGVDTITYAINSIGFEFIGSGATKDNHAAVEAHGYFWDYMSRCDVIDWHVTVNGAPVYGQDITYTTYEYPEVIGDCDADGKCDLINAFTAALKDVTVANGDSIVFTADFGNSVVFEVVFTINAKGELAVSFAGVPNNLIGTTVPAVVPAEDIK
ncbi:MAG: S-layer homology domain-containing protein [Eubacteriales bacterium]